MKQTTLSAAKLKNCYSSPNGKIPTKLIPTSQLIAELHKKTKQEFYAGQPIDEYRLRTAIQSIAYEGIIIINRLKSELAAAKLEINKNVAQ